MSEYGSAGPFGAGLGGLLCGVKFSLVFTRYSDESHGGDVGSLSVPKKLLVERVMEKVYVPNVTSMSISFLLHQYFLNQ